MEYIGLQDFMKQKHKEEYLERFYNWIKLVGFEGASNDAWDIASFDLTGLKRADIIGNTKTYDILFDLDDGMATFYLFKPIYNERAYVSYWYKIRDFPHVTGQAKYIDFPDDVKPWFIKKFTEFIQEMYEKKGPASED